MSKLEIQHVSKPLPIFTSIIENHVEVNKHLKEVILEHRQNNPEDIESNVKAWHSTWQTHVENPKFMEMCRTVESACDFISEGYFNCNDTNYKVSNMWAMMYEDTDWARRHSHFPSDFSGVYYVDVEPDCAPVIFENVVNDGVHDNNQPLELQPKNGLLALWPGILHHEVPKTKSKRMCISFNLHKK